MPKNIGIQKAFNFRPRKKLTTLETKHIRRYRIWDETNQGEIRAFGSTNIANVNNRPTRKRKMVATFIEENLGAIKKIPKLDMAEDIQHQIDDQIRMREGAMKLMSACSTLNQALETSKNLLTINGRILGLMTALQKKNKQHVMQEYNRQRSSSVVSESPEDACMGRVAISDMRIPLMWKDNVHFTGKTGDQSYYAFALIRCGDQVRDTPLYEITSADTDMYFDLTIIFEELAPHFKMDFEVYYTVITSNEAHGIKTPMRTSMNLRIQKKTIHFKAPKFCLAGHVQLTVDDIRPGIISKDLTMGGQGASGVAVLGDIEEFPVHPLELWGQICFQLAAQPKSMLGDVHKGYIDIEVNSPMNKYYCILRQDYVHCWDSKETTEQCKPVHSLRLVPGLKINQVKNKDMNSVKLTGRDGDLMAILTFADISDCFEWKCALRKQLNNIMSWKHAFTEQMHIEEKKTNRLSIPSKASFYDRIKIEDIANDLTKRQSISSRNGHSIPINDTINSTQSEISSTDSPTLSTDAATTVKVNGHSNNDDKGGVENGNANICESLSKDTSETTPSSNTDPSEKSGLSHPTTLTTPDNNMTVLEAQSLSDQKTPTDQTSVPLTQQASVEEATEQTEKMMSSQQSDEKTVVTSKENGSGDSEIKGLNGCDTSKDITVTVNTDHSNEEADNDSENSTTNNKSIQNASATKQINNQATTASGNVSTNSDKLNVKDISNAELEDDQLFEKTPNCASTDKGMKITSDSQCESQNGSIDTGPPVVTTNEENTLKTCKDATKTEEPVNTTENQDSGSSTDLSSTSEELSSKIEPNNSNQSESEYNKNEKDTPTDKVSTNEEPAKSTIDTTDKHTIQNLQIKDESSTSKTSGTGNELAFADTTANSDLTVAEKENTNEPNTHNDMQIQNQLNSKDLNLTETKSDKLSSDDKKQCSNENHGENIANEDRNSKIPSPS